MSNQTTLTVAELLEMQPGTRENATWINDDFEAVVSDVKSGQKATTATLSDPHTPSITIQATFFGRDCSRLNGKVCHFSGKGMTRTEYKEKQQVTIGDKATVQVVGSANSAPSGGTSNNIGKSTGGSAGSSSVIHGATVGMAINQACSLLRETSEGAVSLEYLRSPDFSKDLYLLASDIIRISRVLEAGKLADSPKHRADPDAKAKEEAAAKAAAEKAEAERRAKEEAEKKAANQTGNVDEDVPF